MGSEALQNEEDGFVSRCGSDPAHVLWIIGSAAKAQAQPAISRTSNRRKLFIRDSFRSAVRERCQKEPAASDDKSSVDQGIRAPHGILLRPAGCFLRHHRAWR